MWTRTSMHPLLHPQNTASLLQPAHLITLTLIRGVVTVRQSSDGVTAGTPRDAAKCWRPSHGDLAPSAQAW